MSFTTTVAVWRDSEEDYSELWYHARGGYLLDHHGAHVDRLGYQHDIRGLPEGYHCRAASEAAITKASAIVGRSPSSLCNLG